MPTAMRYNDADRANLASVRAAWNLRTDADAVRLALRLAAAEATPVEHLARLLDALKIDMEDKAVILLEVYGSAARAWIEAEERAANSE